MTTSLRHAPTGLVLLIGLAGLAGCEGTAAKEKAKPKPVAPAKVEKPPGEADLTTVTLTPEAEKRLEIATVPVERQEVPRTRTLGGEVIVPPGHAITVSSPLGGTLLAPEGGVPAAGSRVERGRVVFRLLPMLSPEARATMTNAQVDAVGQIEQAEKQLAQSKVQLDRAKRLREANLGSEGAVVDAQAQYDVAEAALRAATSRRDALNRTIRGLEGGSIDPLPIEVEADGVLKNLHALAGQTVAPGAMLFDVERLDTVWVRVPVYVGDLTDIDTKTPARVGSLSAIPGDSATEAQPITAPPSGDPIAATVDLFYEVPNRGETFRPGQRVGVTLPLAGASESLVVPRSAVLLDYHGGAWVYAALGDHKYARRRVRLERVVGPQAVLNSGPEPGTPVVTDGAAELFGTEFGGGK